MRLQGQTRDYFNAVEVLLVLPGILRVNRLYQEYISNGRGFRDLLNPCLSVLKDLGIETGTGVEVDGTLRLGNEGTMAGRVLVGHPSALLRANPVVAAILQHYGFPTDHLDASTDPQIALWFALHESRTTRRRISFPPTHVPFWFKPDTASNFGLSTLTMFTGSSPMLAIPS